MVGVEGYLTAKGSLPMTKGTVYPSESKILSDEQTGARIRQVTDHRSIHHHPFFFVPAYDTAMRRLVFVSHRTGDAQVFAEDQGSGDLIQLTDRRDLDEWSVYPSRNGRFVLFTAGGAAWRLDLETLEEVMLTHFGAGTGKEEGMVGPAMGTTALSWDDAWWAVPVKMGENFRFFVINTETGRSEMILERDKIGHPQFCPDDPTLLLYIATMDDRIWVINRDGSGNRQIYKRNEARNEWITHETWIPGRREISFVDWPHGARAINIDSGQERPICRFNAWHAVCDHTGTMMVVDTNFPDIGMQLLNPLDGIGEPKTLCLPKASQVGDHWNGPYPYGNGPIKVYAPQHTHVHPSFAPDNSRIVYASDCSGHAQIYECFL
jgi:oligogalacturonide lyase